MAKFIFEGINDLVATYQRLGIDTDQMVRRAVYNGAKVVADGTKAALQALPTDDSFDRGEPRTSITSKQKAGLIDGFGISKMKEENGYINVKLGVHGRNKERTKTFPGGEPNVAVARQLETGTSYMQKNPVFSRTAKNLKNACEQAMQDSLDRDLKAIE